MHFCFIFSLTRHLGQLCHDRAVKEKDQLFQVWDFEDSYNYNMSQTKVHNKPLHCIDWSTGNGHLVATAGDAMNVYVYRMSDKVSTLRKSVLAEKFPDNHISSKYGQSLSQNFL
jgi:hypothetical protein